MEHGDQKAVRFKQGYDKAINIIDCDEANSSFGSENCSYSLETIERTYKYYSLGLLCNTQPGKHCINTNEINNKLLFFLLVLPYFSAFFMYNISCSSIGYEHY